MQRAEVLCFKKWCGMAMFGGVQYPAEGISGNDGFGDDDGDNGDDDGDGIENGSKPTLWPLCSWAPDVLCYFVMALCDRQSLPRRRSGCNSPQCLPSQSL